MVNLEKMKSLVEISKIVTASDNFYEIKDLIISKMLAVVHPTKACVNLFYGNDYSYAHLVCSATLDYIPSLFPQNDGYGAKIDFKYYPQYIHDAVTEKREIIIDNIFEDERASGEEEMAMREKYVGRAVFPFVLENKTVGFMTCFTKADEKLEKGDIEFISQVASLMTLSISITEKNNGINKLVEKLRRSISNINKASKQIYSTKDIKYYINKMLSVLIDTLHSECSVITMTNHKNDKDILLENFPVSKPFVSNEDIEKIISETADDSSICNIGSKKITLSDGNSYSSSIYYKALFYESIEVEVVCLSNTGYSEDDMNTLSILMKQVSLGIQAYQNSIKEEKHKEIENDLSILKKQQKLIMDNSTVNRVYDKEIFYYHDPAKVVGGDFFHSIEIDDKVVFIIADVMGHGIASNYVVALIKGAFDILVRYSKTPKDILYNLNRYLFNEFDEMGIYATSIVGVMSKYNSQLQISSAGHYYPLIIDNDGNINHNQNLKRGLPLGIMEDSYYTNIDYDMKNVEQMCFYTDGILEMQDENEDEYGSNRLEAFLIKNRNKTKKELITNLKSEIDGYIYNKEKKDDILIVFIKKITGQLGC